MLIPAAFAATASALAVLVAVPALQVASQPAAATDVIEVATDRYDRLTVPVRIGADGPFQFLIDTGSERTVLSRSLAERLRLPPGGRAIVLGIAGPLPVDLVEVDEVTLGRRSFYGLSAPLLDAAHIGADGIIGLDGLQEQRVLLDFQQGIMAVDDRHALGGDGGFEIVVRARRRSGQLIMTNAVVDGVRADVVIDTGAQMSIANPALLRHLARRRQPKTAALLSVTGQQIAAQMVVVRSMKLGSLVFGNVALAVADSPTFGRLRLGTRPAILLGMNELRAFKRVAIDFESRKVLFDLPADAGMAPG